MADVKKETILLQIDTNFGDLINEVGSLQTRIDKLNASKRDMQNENKKLIESNKELAKDYEKNREAIAKNEKIMEANNKQIAQDEVVLRNLSERQREYKKEIENEIKARQENEGSIKQMRLQLIELRKEYESLSKADRESEGGRNMLADIQRQTEEVKKLEYQQLDFRRNIGNYADSLMNIDPALAKLLNGFKALSQGTMQTGVAMKNVIPAIKAFLGQMKALIATPVGAAITAIVVIFKTLHDAIKRNDDALTALQGLLAAFSPILEVLRGALDAVVKVLTKVIDGAAKAVTAVLGLIPAFRESSEAARDYVKAMDDLEEKERQYGVQTAKNESEISELRAKAIQKDKYSAEQRKQFLEEASALEKENLRMEKEVAEEKLRLAKEDAARRHDTTDETKNQIADLEANVWRAVKSYNDGMRSIVKATQRAMKEIDKETNKDLSFSQWKKGVAERTKAFEDAKKAYMQALADWNSDKTNSQKQAQLKAAQDAKEQAEAELNNYKELEDDAKRHSKEMQNIAKNMSKNLLEARKGYEEALIDLMDESLEKQLKVLEEQNRQEIDALKEKLLTEENLTKEARDYINKTIQLKEKKFYEQRILMESNYWVSVRQNAIQTINTIFDAQSKLASSDPNRNIQQFIINLRKQLLGVATEFEDFSNDIAESYQVQFQALKTAAGTALNRGKDEFWGTEYTKNVKTLLDEITNGIGKFTKENTKTIDQFYNNIIERQRELGFTDKEAKQFAESVKPYYERINELYEQYIKIPKNYAIETANIIYNEMNANAKKIQDQIFKSFSFEGLSDDFIKNAKKEIKKIDTWLKTINLSNMSTPQATMEDEDMFDEIMSISSIKVDWSKVGKDAEKFAKMYGDELSNTLSGALKFLSGSDDLEEQMEWLVSNYEKAISKIDKYNKDLFAAYNKTGDRNFLNAMFDTATIEPNLRKLYDKAMEYGKDTTDYDLQKIEAQKKYVGESDRELKIQNDVLEIENRRLEKKKQQETAQLNYAKSVRDEVAALEEETNQEITISRHEIANREEIIQKRKEEAQQIAENIKLIQENEKLTDDEKKQMISELQKQLTEAEQAISKAQDDVRKLEEKIANMLQKFGELGFMSTEQVDEAIKSLGLSIAKTDAQIQENTSQTTQNVRTMWLNTFTNITGGLGQVSNAFNSLFTEMGNLNERYDEYAEAAAYFSIMLSLAEGIATAVAKGIEMGWPAAAVMIPVGIGLVVGSIASALQVYNQAHKPNYAEGGLIGGRIAKTRSEGRRDDVPINASVGEYVVNAKATKQYKDLLDLINFGKTPKFKLPTVSFADGGYVSQLTAKATNEQIQMDNMREMMIDAMSEISPVVSVKEIAKVQHRVKVKEGIAQNK